MIGNSHKTLARRSGDREDRMKANTRLFGEIDIADEKIITLESGMIGFPELQKFTLIYDEEKNDSLIRWFQSMDDPQVAFPVIEPSRLFPSYSPTVDNSMLEALGEMKDESVYLLNTITVPKDIEKMAVNLKAPIIINTDTRKGCQLIVEDDYPVKRPIYRLLKEKKEKAGE